MGREVTDASIAFDYDRAKMGISKGDEFLWIDPKLFIHVIDRLRRIEQRLDVMSGVTSSV